MNEEHLYEISLNWDNDRKGTLSAPVLDKTIEVATPPPFPKGMEGIWSPEHLFVASVSGCLMTTFLAIAENSKLEFATFSCKAAGRLEMTNGQYHVSEITLMPLLAVKKEKDKERAVRILEKSEAACLISNSIKSKIILKPEVIIAETI